MSSRDWWDREPRGRWRDLDRKTREYCEANGLESRCVSVTFNAAGEITGHEDLTRGPLPGFHVDLGNRCCCGVEGCDGGLAERGIDPASLTSYTATIPLGGGS